MVDTARDLLHSLAWNADTRIFGAANVTTAAFTTFLSDSELSDTHIDIMATYLQTRLDLEPERRPHTYIETLALTYALERASGPEAFNQPSQYLRNIEDTVRKDKFAQILFPAFVPDKKHWIAVEIDFYRKQISFGDSLRKRPYIPANLLKQMQWWLEKRFGGPFEEKGNVLRHGIQKDSISCGIIAMDTISHAAFGGILWTHGRKVAHRLKWFHIVTNEHGISHDREHRAALQNESSTSVRLPTAITDARQLCVSTPGDLSPSLPEPSQSTSRSQSKNLAAPGKGRMGIDDLLNPVIPQSEYYTPFRINP
ncbi:hypothetical protein K474DRAFT_1714375 [Panus rudis PR-1116 ss-1]|nr:hypothetical protein K474DRAFT_1714375 [Panus rudis PR-1116 ss-1]